MASKLEDILVVCSVDDALCASDFHIPACNLATVKLYESMGGNFTVATGRTVESLQNIIADLRLNCPAITCGGEVLYNVENKQHLNKTFLQYEKTSAFVQAVLEKFPDMGIEIYVHAGEIHQVQSNRYTQKHLLKERIGCIISPLEAIPHNWVKVVFAADPVSISKLKQFFKGEEIPGLYLKDIGIGYCEIAATATPMSDAMQALCEYKGIPIENTVFIGGSKNDIELMHSAGFAVAVQNAPNEVKLSADEIVLSCEHGGVGEYLYSLIKRYT